VQDTKNFTAREFECPCCGREKMDQGFVDKLQSLRDLLDAKISVVSGWRCARHNKKVGGKVDSPHLFGHAADIACKGSRSRFNLIEALIEVGFSRIGIAEGFIHADDDPDKIQNVIWLY